MADLKDPHAPYQLYRSSISYFSGKLEAYLRYKGIEHELRDVDRDSFQEIYLKTGVKKMPAMQSRDDLWLFDTTPTIEWLETRYDDHPVLPDDPALAFIALLIEDYGDEWLWRPAMWWRWVPRVSRWGLGWKIAAEMIGRPLARLGGWYFGRRQMSEWLWNDGVNKSNEKGVSDMLYREFEFLEPLFERQAYLLGDQPSVADFGYFASMFRHFGNDPESSEVMRTQAPGTYEWLARLWNAKSYKFSETQTWVWPEDVYWQPLLDRIANDYLPYLHQNAMAFQAGQSRFNYSGKNLNFPKTKTTNYRVWCREVLQQRFLALNQAQQAKVSTLFDAVGGFDLLMQDGVIDSGLAGQFKLPRNPAKSKPKMSLRITLGGQPRN